MGFTNRKAALSCPASPKRSIGIHAGRHRTGKREFPYPRRASPAIDAFLRRSDNRAKRSILAPINPQSWTSYAPETANRNTTADTRRNCKLQSCVPLRMQRVEDNARAKNFYARRIPRVGCGPTPLPPTRQFYKIQLYKILHWKIICISNPSFGPTQVFRFRALRFATGAGSDPAGHSEMIVVNRNACRCGRGVGGRSPGAAPASIESQCVFVGLCDEQPDLASRTTQPLI